MVEVVDKSLETYDKLALRGREWPPLGSGEARGTIVVVHGLGEHIGRHAHVAEFLVARGWRVVAYDQRGHGRSGGERGRLHGADDLLVDLALVVDSVRAEHPGPLVLLGHSLGGLVAARFVAGALQAPVAPAWSRPVDALVMSSPALDAGMNAVQKVLLAVLGRIAPDLGVGNGLDRQGISRDAAVVAAYEADPLVHDRVTPRLARFVADAGAIVASLAPRWTVSTLLLYAGQDRLVAPAGSAAFAAAAPKSVVTAQAFAPLFHEIFNEPEQAEVLSVLGAWLDTLSFSHFSLRSPR
ncbi:MAG TPA: lysophospholipase [Caldimonas sp.]|nr:lysophospholipase [Caldimonas sp.]